MTILTDMVADIAQIELDEAIELQSDNDLFCDDLSALATDIDSFLRKRERSFRTTDPELHAEVEQELENMKSRIKGLAVLAGVVRDVINRLPRSEARNEPEDQGLEFNPTEIFMRTVLSFDQYPGAIANIQTQILRLRQDLRLLKESEHVIVSRLQGQVAANPEYSNDTKRKAALAEAMQNDPDLLMTRSQIAPTEDRIAGLEIDLERRRGEFSVLKLDMRLQIANLMLQAEAA